MKKDTRRARELAARQDEAPKVSKYAAKIARERAAMAAQRKGEDA